VVKRLLKLIALLFVVLIAAVVIVPLVVLAGLFVWLKMTEETNDDVLDLEQELEPSEDAATTETA
jgi:hypothetical protein